MKPARRLIILEGPDCVGKTTLGKFLARKYGGVFMHCSGHKDLHKCMGTYHDQVLRDVEFNVKQLDHIVILDRSWISEKIYGAIFRPDLQKSFPFDDLANRIKEMRGLYILCDSENVMIRHTDQKDPEHPYKQEDFEKIVAGYRDLANKKIGADPAFFTYTLESYGQRLDDYAELVAKL